eukprot:CFRG6648T1
MKASKKNDRNKVITTPKSRSTPKEVVSNISISDIPNVLAAQSAPTVLLSPDLSGVKYEDMVVSTPKSLKVVRSNFEQASVTDAISSKNTDVWSLEGEKSNTEKGSTALHFHRQQSIETYSPTNEHSTENSNVGQGISPSDPTPMTSLDARDYHFNASFQPQNSIENMSNKFENWSRESGENESRDTLNVEEKHVIVQASMLPLSSRTRNNVHSSTNSNESLGKLGKWSESSDDMYEKVSSDILEDTRGSSKNAGVNGDICTYNTTEEATPFRKSVAISTRTPKSYKRFSCNSGTNVHADTEDDVEDRSESARDAKCCHTDSVDAHKSTASTKEMSSSGVSECGESSSMQLTQCIDENTVCNSRSNALVMEGVNATDLDFRDLEVSQFTENMEPVVGLQGTASATCKTVSAVSDSLSTQSKDDENVMDSFSSDEDLLAFSFLGPSSVLEKEPHSSGTTTTNINSDVVAECDSSSNGQYALRVLRPRIEKATVLESSFGTKKKKKKSRLNVDDLLKNQTWRKPDDTLEGFSDESSRQSFNFEEYERWVQAHNAEESAKLVYEMRAVADENEGRSDIVQKALNMNAALIEDSMFMGEVLFYGPPSKNYGKCPYVEMINQLEKSPVVEHLRSCRDWEAVRVAVTMCDISYACRHISTVPLLYVARWLIAVATNTPDMITAERSYVTLSEVLTYAKDALAGKFSLLDVIQETFVTFGMSADRELVFAPKAHDNPAFYLENTTSETHMNFLFPATNFKYFMKIITIILVNRVTIIPTDDGISMLQLLLKAALDKKSHTSLPQVIECIHQLLLILSNKEDQVLHAIRSITNHHRSIVFLCSILPWSPFERRLRTSLALFYALNALRENMRESDTCPESTDMYLLEDVEFDDVAVVHIICALEKTIITDNTNYSLLFSAVNLIGLSVNPAMLNNREKERILEAIRNLRIKDQGGKFPVRTKVKDALYLIDHWLDSKEMEHLPKKKQARLQHICDTLVYYMARQPSEHSLFTGRTQRAIKSVRGHTPEAHLLLNSPDMHRPLIFLMSSSAALGRK